MKRGDGDPGGVTESMSNLGEDGWRQRGGRRVGETDRCRPSNDSLPDNRRNRATLGRAADVSPGGLTGGLQDGSGEVLRC